MVATVTNELGKGIKVVQGAVDFRVPGTVIVNPATGLPHDVTTPLPIKLGTGVSLWVNTGTLVYATTTIAQNATSTAAINLGAGRLASIGFPADWTLADLNVQISCDGGVTYADMYSVDGVKYVIKGAASRCVLLPLADFMAHQYIKLVSTTAQLGGTKTLNLKSVS